MELTQLRQFQVIATCNTLTQAAEQLHVSQPALSTMLRKLEKELNVSLFERTQNRITLNPVGELALTHVNGILDQVEQMKENLEHYANRENTISIAFCDPGPMWYVVPQFSIAHPHMKLHSRLVEKNEDTMNLLLNRQEDIVVGLERITNPEIVSIPFLKDQLLLSVPESSALSRRLEISIKKDCPKELRTILQFDVGGDWFNKVQQPFWKQVSPEIELVLYQDFFLFSQMVKGTNAVTISTKLVKNYRDDGDNRILIPLTDKELSIVYYLSCRKKSSKRLESFLEWSKNLIP